MKKVITEMVLITALSAMWCLAIHNLATVSTAEGNQFLRAIIGGVCLGTALQLTRKYCRL